MPPENNPYEFITGTPAPPAPGKVPIPKIAGEANSIRRRVIIVVSGLVVLIIVAVIVQEIIASAGKANAQIFANVAQNQSEIIAISTKANSKGTALAVKNLAITAQLSLQSTQGQFLSEMKKVGTPLAANQVSKDDPTIEGQLTNAISIGTYDTTYSQIMQAQLVTYASSLQTAFKDATSQTLKTQLANDYTQAQLLENLATTANNNSS